MTAVVRFRLGTDCAVPGLCLPTWAQSKTTILLNVLFFYKLKNKTRIRFKDLRNWTAAPNSSSSSSNLHLTWKGDGIAWQLHVTVCVLFWGSICAATCWHLCVVSLRCLMSGWSVWVLLCCLCVGVCVKGCQVNWSFFALTNSRRGQLIWLSVYKTLSSGQ